MSYQLTGDLRVNAEVGVILPTYREADNIAQLIYEIEDLPLHTSILVIDDSSPDRTAEIVKNLQKKFGNILLYVRPKKDGLGTAITDGFKIFLSLKFSPRFIVTMDADYSHSPKAVPQLLSKMQSGCGIVIGSRYCKGGKIAGWPSTRKIISRTANIVAKFLSCVLALYNLVEHSIDIVQNGVKSICSGQDALSIHLIKDSLGI